MTLHAIAGASGKMPEVITPVESWVVVDAILRAEQSARENCVISFTG